MHKVLVAEDEVHMASFIQRILRRQGVESEVVSDGEKALQAVQENHYDAMVLNLELPVRSGWEVIKELRQQRNLLPIIATTARIISLRQVLAMGANACLMKPFEFSELLSAIQQHTKITTT